MPLYVHMHDSARVGHRLWREWLPAAERRLITDAVGGDDAAAEALVVWLAGVHDVGKATPNFQCKAPERDEEVRETGLDVPPRHMMQGRSCPTPSWVRSSWMLGSKEGLGSFRIRIRAS